MVQKEIKKREHYYASHIDRRNRCRQAYKSIYFICSLDSFSGEEFPFEEDIDFLDNLWSGYSRNNWRPSRSKK